jgi:hypothetical protein
MGHAVVQVDISEIWAAFTNLQSMAGYPESAQSERLHMRMTGNSA